MKLETHSRVCIIIIILPNPQVFRRGYKHTEKVFYCFYKTAWRYSRFFILLSKPTYRPMTARVLSSMFSVLIFVTVLSLLNRLMFGRFSIMFVCDRESDLVFGKRSEEFLVSFNFVDNFEMIGWCLRGYVSCSHVIEK